MFMVSPFYVANIFGTTEDMRFSFYSFALELITPPTIATPLPRTRRSLYSQSFSHHLQRPIMGSISHISWSATIQSQPVPPVSPFPNGKPESVPMWVSLTAAFLACLSIATVTMPQSYSDANVVINIFLRFRRGAEIRLISVAIQGNKILLREP